MCRLVRCFTCTKKILVWLSRRSFRRSKYHVLRSGESGICRSEGSTRTQGGHFRKQAVEATATTAGGEGENDPQTKYSSQVGRGKEVKRASTSGVDEQCVN